MSLDYESVYKDRVYKVVLLSPCTVPDKKDFTSFDGTKVLAFDALNIFELGGPTWDTTIVKLADALGWQ